MFRILHNLKAVHFISLWFTHTLTLFRLLTVCQFQWQLLYRLVLLLIVYCYYLYRKMIRIHPDLFKCKRAITETHVRAIWPVEAHDASPHRIQVLITETEAIKKDCADWARANIQAVYASFGS